jgi:hypothetical protein
VTSTSCDHDQTQNLKSNKIKDDDDGDSEDGIEIAKLMKVIIFKSK